MAFGSTCVRGITVLSVLSVLIGPVPVRAAPFRFERGRYQPEDLDSVSTVSGASILRAFPQALSAYHCPTSRVWIGELDTDRTKVATSLQPTTGGDYGRSRTGRLTFTVGRARDGGRGPTVVVFCFARGDYPKATAVTSGFVVPPDARVSSCTADAKKVGTPLRCR